MRTVSEATDFIEADPAAADGPAWTWDAWTDEDRWEPTPDLEEEDTRDNAVAFIPEPDVTAGPSLPMADWIASKASEIRSLNSDLASWLAARIDELAHECRVLRATTPDEFDGRSEAMAETSSWRLTPSEWDARDRYENEQEAEWLAEQAAARIDSDRLSAGVGCL